VADDTVGELVDELDRADPDRADPDRADP